MAVAASAACNMTQAATLLDVCPGITNATDMKHDMSAMVTMLCEPGACKSLIDALQPNCNETEDFEEMFTEIDQMCSAADGTTCPENSDMLWVAMASSCPKLLAYAATDPEDEASPPEDVIAEVCEAGACHDKREALEQLCKGSAALEGNLTMLEDLCEDAGHDHDDHGHDHDHDDGHDHDGDNHTDGDDDHDGHDHDDGHDHGNGDGDGKGAVSGGSVVAPGLASLVAVTAWLQ